MKVLSIRQKVESALLAWLQASFAGKQEFSGVQFTKGQTSVELAMPFIGALCPNAEEVEVPGAGIFMAESAVVLMTAVDSGKNPDENVRASIDAAHQARADCVANKLEDTAAVIADLSASGIIVVYGFDLGKSSHEEVQRHFVDRFDLRIACRCV